GGLDRASLLHHSVSAGVARPRVDGVEVALDVGLLLGGRDAQEHLVARTRAPLVPSLRELLGGVPQRIVALRSEHLVRELAGAHEVHRAREGGDRLLPVLRLVSGGHARHLPCDDAVEPQLALLAPGIAGEEIAHGDGEGLVAHLVAGDRPALGVVDGLAVATAARTTPRRGERHCEEEARRRDAHGGRKSNLTDRSGERSIRRAPYALRPFRPPCRREYPPKRVR